MGALAHFVLPESDTPGSIQRHHWQPAKGRDVKRYKSTGTLTAGQRITFHRMYAAIRMQATFPAATVAVQGNVIREGAAAPRKAASTEDASADLI